MPLKNTHKSLSARETIKFLVEHERIAKPDNHQDNEQLYAWLANYGYTWDGPAQTWRKRQPGTHGPLKRPTIKENSFVLIRIMAKREILDRDRENFALAFEAIGYDVIEFSQPIQNRENGYSRVYLKARTK